MISKGLHPLAMALSKSIEFAQKTHLGQHWKGTNRPMLYHPLAVAALVMKYGGDEAQIDAAILHDLICEPGISFQVLEKAFGTEAATLAYAFEDPPPPENWGTDWASLRKLYLAKIETLSEKALLIVLCEELHELTELMTDLRNEGHATWKRYPVPDRDITWYFRKITEIAYKKRPTKDSLVLDFSRMTRQLVLFVHEGASL